MSNEHFYADKVFKMVDDAQALIEPFGALYCADRDFLVFELSFFYYFIYDYKIFSQLDNSLRGKILNTFLEKMQARRPDDFPNVEAIDKFYETRIFAYHTIKSEIRKIGEFGEKCAGYMNTLITYSEKNNVFTCHSVDQAKKELQPKIEPDKYTGELKVLLTISSSPLLIHGVDPTTTTGDSN